MNQQQILEHSNEFPNRGTKYFKYAGILLFALSIPTAFIQYTLAAFYGTMGFAFLLAYRLDKLYELVIYDNLRTTYVLKHIEDQQNESLAEFLEAEDCKGWSRLNKITDRQGYGSDRE